MDRKNVKYRSHRGGVYYTPENTMPAFEDALRQGFAYIETDPQYTKDGIVVLMHDATINRTCRNKDGSEIEGEIYVRDLTYAELMEYDAGIAKGPEFAGTKVPRLDELLAAAEGRDVIIELDKKIKTDEMDGFLDVVAGYNTRVTFSCADLARIRKIQERFPDAMIDYDGNTMEEDLQAVLQLVKPENLIVWMYMDKPNFSWLTDRVKASKENCARVKKYARLGLGNVCNPYDVMEAFTYDPDVVEV